MTENQIDRRRFLKGLGTLMALPALEGLAPLARAANAPENPVRMAFMFVPNGRDRRTWTPAHAGA